MTSGPQGIITPNAIKPFGFTKQGSVVGGVFINEFNHEDGEELRGGSNFEKLTQKKPVED